MAKDIIYDALVRIEYDYENEYGDTRRGWTSFVGEWRANVPLPAIINKIASELEASTQKGATPDRKNFKNFVVTNHSISKATDL